MSERPLRVIDEIYSDQEGQEDREGNLFEESLDDQYVERQDRPLKRQVERKIQELSVSSQPVSQAKKTKTKKKKSDNQGNVLLE